MKYILHILNTIIWGTLFALFLDYFEFYGYWAGYFTGVFYMIYYYFGLELLRKRFLREIIGVMEVKNPTPLGESHNRILKDILKTIEGL